MHLIVATHNRHKTLEFQEILGGSFALADLSGYPRIILPAETGSSFDENASVKALSVSKHFADLVLADDSGLEVDALNGAPGIFSARYAGEPTNDERNLNKLLYELERVDPVHRERQARFRCVIAIARGGELLKTFGGEVEGTIADRPQGSEGFGYDPIFVPQGFAQTFAELPPATKNSLSHRGRALAAALPFLRRMLLSDD